MPLFSFGSFILAGGSPSRFKIDCDYLSDEDWRCLAWLVSQRVGSFGKVEGVPRGGLALAEALRPYTRGEGPLLIVDDVCTTGGSLERQRAGREAMGAVVFARSGVPSWVTPLFIMPAFDAL